MKTVILFGDSLFARWNKSAVNELEQKLPEVLVINCATGGHSTRDALPRADVLKHLPNAHFLVSLGMNDLASWKRVPLDEYSANLERIVSSLGAERVTLMELQILVEDQQPGPDIRTNSERDSYNQALLSVANRTGCPVISTAQEFKKLIDKGTVFYIEDGVHYNEDGMKVLIDTIAQQLHP